MELTKILSPAVRLMDQRRKHPRVEVGLPVACVFIDPGDEQTVTSHGTAFDLSLKGMKVSVPIPLPLRKARALNYYLDLPKPFTEITGNAHIKWTRRSPDNRSVVLGVEFHSLSDEQWSDLQTIIQELLATGQN
jgi:hypothetical protein